jgi:hypothetical protein
MNRYADSLIKIFPILVAIAGGLWTVQTYFANLEQTSRQEQAAREKELSASQRTRLNLPLGRPCSEWPIAEVRADRLPL